MSQEETRHTPPAFQELPPSTRYQSGPGKLDAYLPGGSKYTGAVFGEEPKPATRKRKPRKGAKGE